jgi:DNA-binding transcriptional MerR regulator
MDKSPDAFRTISEVAEHLDTPAHVLRFWESRFPQIRPVKRAGGRRYYRPSDIALLTGIKRLLHDEGLTIRGVQKILRDHGVRHVAGLQDESLAVADPGLIADGAAAPPAASEADPDARSDLPEGEAGFIAIEDDEDEVIVPSPPPLARPAPVQPSLPLFEVVAAHRALREDVTVATLIRRLPRAALAPSRAPVEGLARRLAALRARMAERAEGGPGPGA